MTYITVNILLYSFHNCKVNIIILLLLPNDITKVEGVNLGTLTVYYKYVFTYMSIR